jgi:gliding motility-associated lipoprotein GldJ
MNRSVPFFHKLLFAGLLLSLLGSCKLFKKKDNDRGFQMQVQSSTSVHKKGMVSQVTGIPYNLEDTTNNVTAFVVREYLGQPDGPNLVFIEGGRFVMGSGEEDILYTRDNKERTISVQSFYMDRTEVANVHWLEFLNFYSKAQNSGQIPDSLTYEQLLPDTTVWASEKAFNDSYVSNYLRYPGFRLFPVVGVSWVQAQAFCKWRTRAVNEYLFAEAKKKDKDGKLNEIKPGDKIPLETGVVLPDYRLPTEAEWEYAAKGMIGTQYDDENQANGRVYPWDGHALRNPYGKQMGTFLANFKRGRGDYAGIAGKQNDGALITEWVYAYPPNDYGLYNMAGNVNEWVEDVYRPLSFEDVDDLNPVRRLQLDSTRLRPDPTKSVYEDPADAYNKIGDNNGTPVAMAVSLVDDNSRVYKGGSWKDVAYWLAPGTRRFLDKTKSTDDLGFRCAMIMAGERDGEKRRKNDPKKLKR